MDVEEVIKKLNEFKTERNWDKFHSLANLSRALSVETSEVEKIFLWKKSDEELSKKDKEELKLELADVLSYVYYMCNKLELDPNKIVLEKLNINKKRHWEFENENDKN